MFVLLNQLRTGDMVAEDVKNIREFYPEEVELEDGTVLKGTVINLYQGSPWVVSQCFNEVYEACLSKD